MENITDKIVNAVDKFLYWDDLKWKMFFNFPNEFNDTEKEDTKIKVSLIKEDLLELIENYHTQKSLENAHVFKEMVKPIDNNKKFTRLSVESSYGSKISYEFDYEDTSMEELLDAFFTLMIGETWHPKTIIESMAEFAEEKKESYGVSDNE